MKPIKCKFCLQVDKHCSFQCHLNPKNQKTGSVSVMTWEQYQEKKGNNKLSKPRSPINLISTKQAKINAAYSVLRTQFLKTRRYCEARLEGCTGQAEHVHHQYMGSNKRKHYLNTLTWTPICHSCHTICHDKLSKEEQIEKGLRILD